MRSYRSIIVGLVLLFSAVRPAASQVVCQLGYNQVPFNPMANQPASPFAVNEIQTIYKLLCPAGCGMVDLFINPTTPNAMTVTLQPGSSIISYEPSFMGQVFQWIGPEATFGILAHEFGHHVDLTTNPPAWMDHGWGRELRADAWAGCALARRGYSPAQLVTSLHAIAAYPSPSHPAWNLRIPAVQQGYLACGGNPQALPWKS